MVLLRKACLIGLTGLLAQQAQAELCDRGVFSSSVSVIVPSTITGSRDAYEPGTLVSAGTLSAPKQNVLYSDCTPTRVTATGIGKPVPGVVYVLDGRAHQVYDTGVPGIGYAVMASVGWNAQGAREWKALDLNETALDIAGLGLSDF